MQMVLLDKHLVLTYFGTLLHGMCSVALLYALVIINQREMKRKLRNQRFILTNLFTIEFLTALFFVKIQIEELTGRRKGTIEGSIEFGARVALAVNYPFSMHHIAVDRFLEVYLHMKYPMHVTERVTKVTIVAMWIFGVLFSVTVVLLQEFVYTPIKMFTFMSYYVLLLDVTILLNAIVTYSYLYRAFIRLRAIDRRNSLRKLKSGKFRIPVLIILTYCLFEVSGAILSMAAYAAQLKEMLLVRKVSLLLYGFGFLADVFIYILCHQLDQRKRRRQNFRSDTVSTVTEDKYL